MYSFSRAEVLFFQFSFESVPESCSDELIFLWRVSEVNVTLKT